MRPRHLLLALSIVLIWGVNFAIIKLGLRQVSPLALGVMRFFLAAFPWVFFIKRPNVPLSMIATYGLLIFALQFGFLFTGMKIGMSAGLSSLILQLQVFFTIGLSMILLGERPTPWQLAGAVLAFSGVGMVALHIGGDVSMVGLLLLIAAAAAWGGGNVVSKQISQRAAAAPNVLGLVVWGSLFALPPLLAVALVLDPQHFISSFAGLDRVSVGSIAYIVYLSTLFGFAAWSGLLARYPVSTVAPFTLLVPVFGFLGSAVLLGEPLQGWKLGASSLVIAGLCINLFGPRLFSRPRRSAVPPPSPE
ncbi:EamA family transporter [Aminobacter sp. UC22_36]|uniref:EamA family transporter n=1 Tax=Aminobacter sp. UC22_36 TaxID=3374549 RepID=UPI003757E1D5